MAEIIWRGNRDQYLAELDEMYERRDAVFFDQMGWCREAAGIEKGWDCDRFDDEHAIYIIQKNARTGRLVAHCRLLRTDRPHMMTDVFSHMCNHDEGIPIGTNVLEFTRVCYDREQMEPSEEYFRWVRGAFCTAVTEFCVRQGVDTMTYVVTEAHLRSLQKRVWPSFQLGDFFYDPNIDQNLTAAKGLTDKATLERIRTRLLGTNEQVLFYKGPMHTTNLEIVRAA